MLLETEKNFFFMVLEEVSLEKLYQWSKEVVKKYQLEVMVLDKQAQKKAGLNTWTNWVINRYLFYGLSYIRNIFPLKGSIKVFNTQNKRENTVYSML